MLKLKSLILLFIFVCATSTLFAYTESEVLPKNVWRLRFPSATFSATEAFDSHGNKVKLVADSAYTDPASELAPYLGEDHIYGTITSDGVFHGYVSGPVIEYGITDKTTLKAYIPFYLSGGINYNFGWKDNTDDDSFLLETLGAADPYGEAVLAATRDAYPDAKLTQLGDIEIGIQHLFYQSPGLLCAYAIGSRLATGDAIDDVSIDQAPAGDGQADIGLYFLADKLFGELNKVGSGCIGGWLKYENQLPADYNFSNGVSYRKDLGNYLKTMVRGSYNFSDYVVAKFGMAANFKAHDTIDGAKVADSCSNLYYCLPSIEISNYKAKVPFTVNLEYTLPVRGTNSMAVESFMLELQLYLQFWGPKAQ